MNNDEKNTNIPQPEADLPGSAAGEESADAFLEQLYSDSLQDLTSDFDTLLKEFQSIDPDDPAVEPAADTTAEPAAQPEDEEIPSEPPVQEMEDIYSYSDHEQAQTHMSFSESVQQAMEAEEAEIERAEAEDDAFNLSMDQLDGTQASFADAVEEASAPSEMQRTQIYSAKTLQQAAAKTQAPRPAADIAKKSAGKQKSGKKRKRSLLPQKNDSMFEIFRKVLFLVSMVVVIVCLGIIANTYLIQPAVEKGRQSKYGDMMTNNVSDADSFNNAYPDTEYPEGARYDLAQFYAANQDFYGYLEINGSNVHLSTPVVQGKDNKEYLRKNLFGQTTKYGVPFLNYKNTYAALDYNTSIFGHNMEYDDLVFGELEKYRKIDAFKDAPLIHLETMYADYTFKIYAVFLTDSAYDSSGWLFNYIFTQLKDENECREYIAEMDQRKLYSTGVDILPTDKLLTLSTCAYDFSDERLVVVGRLVREGESAEVDVSKAVINNNPRYPDKYYQRKGLSNPYSNAAKWIPNA